MSGLKNSKRCLITGCSGFIFSNVLEYLLEKTDWTFVCPVTFRHKGNPLRIKPNDRVEVPTLDLTGEIPDLGEAEYLIHGASQSHVDRSIQDPVPFVENNISITLQVLEYARKYKPEKFLLFATDEIFGDSGGNDLTPSNPYAASKAAQALVSQAYQRTYGVPVVTTTSNNIIGKNQDPEKFVPKITELIKSGETVQLHAVNGEFGTRYYNYVDNVSAALLFILEHGKVGERYNLPGGKKLSNLEMAQEVAKLLGKELKYEVKDAGEDRPGYDRTYPEPDSRLTNMGFTPPVKFEDGLRRTVLNG